jgi:hypothetical protein
VPQRQARTQRSFRRTVPDFAPNDPRPANALAARCPAWPPGVVVGALGIHTWHEKNPMLPLQHPSEKPAEGPPALNRVRLMQTVHKNQLRNPPDRPACSWENRTTSGTRREKTPPQDYDTWTWYRWLIVAKGKQPAHGCPRHGVQVMHRRPVDYVDSYVRSRT